MEKDREGYKPREVDDMQLYDIGKLYNRKGEMSKQNDEKQRETRNMQQKEIQSQEGKDRGKGARSPQKMHLWHIWGQYAQQKEIKVAKPKYPLDQLQKGGGKWERPKKKGGQFQKQ